MVSARQQLIERRGNPLRAGILADGGKIRGDLAIQQTELLQLLRSERPEVARPGLPEQIFEAPPGRRALIEPAAGDHEWIRLTN